MDIAIKVENLSKKYIIRHKESGHYITLRGVIADEAKNILNKIRGKLTPVQKREEFWALKDISFEVEKGDKIGIIGRNGAGKSTLLKIISRITRPTSGQIYFNGRVSSLLEVGTGFHPELTGRENIYLNGAILGMRMTEIKRNFNKIVDFAEVERFLDTPVKRYSSGMYVRLAFAVAAHLQPDILLVDEVLAVGDAQFQKKCIGRMEDVSKEGRTILFVSHNMGTIREFCNSAILLDKGEIVSMGDVNTVADEYVKRGFERGKLTPNSFTGTLTSYMEFEEIFIDGKEIDAILSPFSDIEIMVRGICKKEVPNFRTSFAIFKGDVRIFTTYDTMKAETLRVGKFESKITIPALLLRPGDYSISIGGFQEDAAPTYWILGTDLALFTIQEEWNAESLSHALGIVNLPPNGTRKPI